MPEIRLVKRYPQIKDEDVTSIFQEGYLKGFENGRKGAIPIEWIEKYKRVRGWEVTVTTQNAIDNMLNVWEKENEID